MTESDVSTQVLLPILGLMLVSAAERMQVHVRITNGHVRALGPASAQGLVRALVEHEALLVTLWGACSGTSDCDSAYDSQAVYLSAAELARLTRYRAGIYP